MNVKYILASVRTDAALTPTDRFAVNVLLALLWISLEPNVKVDCHVLRGDVYASRFL